MAQSKVSGSDLIYRPKPKQPHHLLYLVPRRIKDNEKEIEEDAGDGIR